jgi:hypothetical protein
MIAAPRKIMAAKFDFGHLARVGGALRWLGDEAAGV